MKTQLPTRKSMDERLQIALPADQKLKAFEMAAKEGVSVSQLVRRALAAVSAEMAA